MSQWVIERYNHNRFLEQLYDPEKVMWLATGIGGVQANSAANSLANMSVNQNLNAIDYVRQPIANFTAEPDNVWQRVRYELFIPMAVLLLLPGAVLAQVKAIVAQGMPVLGQTSPFDGIIRSIIAIFLIPGSFLVINYGIDVANSLTYTIADEYHRIFGSDMYRDAKCTIIRAYGINDPGSNKNAIDSSETPQIIQHDVWAPEESLSLTQRLNDPCVGVDESRLGDEEAVAAKPVNRALMNGAGAGMGLSWNVLCAFQMVFLYYLWCMGPVAAALWVWPIGKLRSAFGSWVEGVIILCFWALFWNTAIFLLAAFKGVGDQGTVYVSALLWLCNQCVKSAFDFAQLVSGASGGAMANAQQLGQSPQLGQAQQIAQEASGAMPGQGAPGASGTGAGGSVRGALTSGQGSPVGSAGLGATLNTGTSSPAGAGSSNLQASFAPGGSGTGGAGGTGTTGQGQPGSSSTSSGALGSASPDTGLPPGEGGKEGGAGKEGSGDASKDVNAAVAGMGAAAMLGKGGGKGGATAPPPGESNMSLSYSPSINKMGLPGQEGDSNLSGRGLDVNNLKDQGLPPLASGTDNKGDTGMGLAGNQGLPGYGDKLDANVKAPPGAGDTNNLTAAGAGAALGPDGKPMLGPDGKPLGQDMLGPDGKPLLGADGKPIGQDGPPVLGPDGKPMLGADGKPLTAGVDTAAAIHGSPDGQLHSGSLQDRNPLAKDLAMDQMTKGGSQQDIMKNGIDADCAKNPQAELARSSTEKLMSATGVSEQTLDRALNGDQGATAEIKDKMGMSPMMLDKALHGDVGAAAISLPAVGQANPEALRQAAAEGNTAAMTALKVAPQTDQSLVTAAALHNNPTAAGELLKGHQDVAQQTQAGMASALQTSQELREAGISPQEWKTALKDPAQAGSALERSQIEEARGHVSQAMGGASFDTVKGAFYGDTQDAATVLAQRGNQEIAGMKAMGMSDQQITSQAMQSGNVSVLAAQSVSGDTLQRAAAGDEGAKHQLQQSIGSSPMMLEAASHGSQEALRAVHAATGQDAAVMAAASSNTQSVMSVMNGGDSASVREALNGTPEQREAMLNRMSGDLGVNKDVLERAVGGDSLASSTVLARAGQVAVTGHENPNVQLSEGQQRLVQGLEGGNATMTSAASAFTSIAASDTITPGNRFDAPLVEMAARGSDSAALGVHSAIASNQQIQTMAREGSAGASSVLTATGGVTHTAEAAMPYNANPTAALQDASATTQAALTDVGINPTAIVQGNTAELSRAAQTLGVSQDVVQGALMRGSAGDAATVLAAAGRTDAVHQLAAQGDSSAQLAIRAAEAVPQNVLSQAMAGDNSAQAVLARAVATDPGILSAATTNGHALQAVGATLGDSAIVAAQASRTASDMVAIHPNQNLVHQALGGHGAEQAAAINAVARDMGVSPTVLKDALSGSTQDLPAVVAAASHGLSYARSGGEGVSPYYQSLNQAYENNAPLARAIDASIAGQVSGAVSPAATAGNTISQEAIRGTISNNTELSRMAADGNQYAQAIANSATTDTYRGESPSSFRQIDSSSVVATASGAVSNNLATYDASSGAGPREVSQSAGMINAYNSPASQSVYQANAAYSGTDVVSGTGTAIASGPSGSLERSGGEISGQPAAGESRIAGVASVSSSDTSSGYYQFTSGTQAGSPGVDQRVDGSAFNQNQYTQAGTPGGGVDQRIAGVEQRADGTTISQQQYRETSTGGTVSGVDQTIRPSDPTVSRSVDPTASTTSVSSVGSVSSTSSISSSPTSYVDPTTGTSGTSVSSSSQPGYVEPTTSTSSTSLSSGPSTSASGGVDPIPTNITPTSSASSVTPTSSASSVTPTQPVDASQANLSQPGPTPDRPSALGSVLAGATGTSQPTPSSEGVPRADSTRIADSTQYRDSSQTNVQPTTPSGEGPRGGGDPTRIADVGSSGNQFRDGGQAGVDNRQPTIDNRQPTTDPRGTDSSANYRESGGVNNVSQPGQQPDRPQTDNRVGETGSGWGGGAANRGTGDPTGSSPQQFLRDSNLGYTPPQGGGGGGGGGGSGYAPGGGASVEGFRNMSNDSTGGYIFYDPGDYTGNNSNPGAAQGLNQSPKVWSDAYAQDHPRGGPAPSGQPTGPSGPSDQPASSQPSSQPVQPSDRGPSGSVSSSSYSTSSGETPRGLSGHSPVEPPGGQSQPRAEAYSEARPEAQHPTHQEGPRQEGTRPEQVADAGSQSLVTDPKREDYPSGDQPGASGQGPSPTSQAGGSGPSKLGNALSQALPGATAGAAGAGIIAGALGNKPKPGSQQMPKKADEHKGAQKGGEKGSEGPRRTDVTPQQSGRNVMTPAERKRREAEQAKRDEEERKRREQEEKDARDRWEKGE